ncbi:MAG: hypothetical protein FJ146_06170 [Deltaproteobacteria bacterium]|nr:hypothetical protein [Deltaproteobacteria bacterium]
MVVLILRHICILCLAGGLMVGCRLKQADASKDPTQLGTDRSIVDPTWPVRLSLGGTKSTYTDQQSSDISNLNQSLSGVNLTGKRVMAEGYALLNAATDAAKSMYGYGAMEFRDDGTDRIWWEYQRTYTIKFGLMPMPKIPVMPVIGMYKMWNGFIGTEPNMPDVTKLDVIALLLGVDYIHNIWIKPQEISAFFGGKYHLLNPGGKNTGSEMEIIVGSKLNFGMLRMDVSFGYLMNSYKGAQPTPDETGMLTIKSDVKTTYGMVSFWL